MALAYPGKYREEPTMATTHKGECFCGAIYIAVSGVRSHAETVLPMRNGLPKLKDFFEAVWRLEQSLLE
jgi:hypothetical protein